MSKDNNSAVNEVNNNNTSKFSSEFLAGVVYNSGNNLHIALTSIITTAVDAEIEKSGIGNMDRLEIENFVYPLVVELVEGHNASINPESKESNLNLEHSSPLGVAIHYMLPEVVEYLIDQGADVSYTVHGKTYKDIIKETSEKNDNVFQNALEMIEYLEPPHENNNNNEEENSDSDDLGETSNVEVFILDVDNNNNETPIVGEDNNNNNNETPTEF